MVEVSERIWTCLFRSESAFRDSMGFSRMDRGEERGSGRRDVRIDPIEEMTVSDY